MGKNYVFVYGTLKRGFGNNDLLKTSEFVGIAETESKYLLLESGIPFLVDDPCHSKSCKVKGEVYLTDNEVLNDLDSLEGHPTFYERKPIWITINNKTKYMWTYFYVVDDIEDYNILESGVF